MHHQCAPQSGNAKAARAQLGNALTGSDARGAQGAQWDAAREDFNGEPDWLKTRASLMRALPEIPALSPDPHLATPSAPPAPSTSLAAVRACGGP